MFDNKKNNLNNIQSNEHFLKPINKFIEKL